MKGRAFCSKQQAWIHRGRMFRGERDGREKGARKQKKKAEKRPDNRELNFSADEGHTFQEFVAMLDAMQRGKP